MRKAVGQVSLVEALLPASYGSNQRLERIRAQVRVRQQDGKAALPLDHRGQVGQTRAHDERSSDPPPSG